MFHPIQKIAFCKAVDRNDDSVLVAACGPHLFSISPSTGSVLSAWPRSKGAGEAGEPPEKKRKTEANETSSSANVIELAISNSRSHVIAVTGEDKCVHVFRVEADGQLSHASQRCMPKRPSALAITADDSQILVADKFGDVYSVPLLPNLEEEAEFVEANEGSQKPAKAYKPAASTLTVHSKRNLATLKQQMERANEAVKTKEPLKFVHKLLLGHVSMLTDVLFIRTPPGPGFRDYIVTSDRDEHIRVSRGPPQAHIIEGYCLGPSKLTSRMCLIRPDILVSGGGNDYLCTWAWQYGRLLRRLEIKHQFEKAKEEASASRNAEHDDTSTSKPEIMVSGLWTFPEHTSDPTHLLVACEGYPVLLSVGIQQLVSYADECTTHQLRVPGNVLDVATSGDKVFVAYDNIHEPGRIDSARSEEAPSSRIAVFEKSAENPENFQPSRDAEALLLKAEESVRSKVEEKTLPELLYGFGRLRKREGEDGPGEGE